MIQRATHPVAAATPCRVSRHAYWKAHPLSCCWRCTAGAVAQLIDFDHGSVCRIRTRHGLTVQQVRIILFRKSDLPPIRGAAHENGGQRCPAGRVGPEPLGSESHSPGGPGVLCRGVRHSALDLQPRRTLLAARAGSRLFAARPPEATPQSSLAPPGASLQPPGTSPATSCWRSDGDQRQGRNQDPKGAAPEEHQGEVEIPEDQEGSIRPIVLEAGFWLSRRSPRPADWARAGGSRTHRLPGITPSKVPAAPAGSTRG